MASEWSPWKPKQSLVSQLKNAVSLQETLLVARRCIEMSLPTVPGENPPWSSRCQQKLLQKRALTLGQRDVQEQLSTLDSEAPFLQAFSLVCHSKARGNAAVPLFQHIYPSDTWQGLLLPS